LPNPAIKATSIQVFLFLVRAVQKTIRFIRPPENCGLSLCSLGLKIVTNAQKEGLRK